MIFFLPIIYCNICKYHKAFLACVYVSKSVLFAQRIIWRINNQWNNRFCFISWDADCIMLWPDRGNTVIPALCAGCNVTVVQQQKWPWENTSQEQWRSLWELTEQTWHEATISKYADLAFIYERFLFLSKLNLNSYSQQFSVEWGYFKKEDILFVCLQLA